MREEITFSYKPKIRSFKRPSINSLIHFYKRCVSSYFNIELAQIELSFVRTNDSPLRFLQWTGKKNKRETLQISSVNVDSRAGNRTNAPFNNFSLVY